MPTSTPPASPKNELTVLVVKQLKKEGYYD
jgi:hypothetical protein